MSLSIEEFIGRFLRHVVPKGFYRIRYYGILAAANQAKRKQCDILLKKVKPIALFKGLNPKEIVQVVTGKDPQKCPICKKGKLIAKTILDPV